MKDEGGKLRILFYFILLPSSLVPAFLRLRFYLRGFILFA